MSSAAQHLFFHQALQFLLAVLGPQLLGHICADVEVFAFFAYDHSFADQRGSLDGVLDKLGVHFFAVDHDNHIAFATVYEDKALLVAVAHVSGVEPAIFHSLGAGVAMPPIAFHDAFAFQHQQAVVAFGQLALFVLKGIVAAVLGQEPGHYRAAAAQAVHLFLIGAYHRGGLGQAVALKDRHAHVFEEYLMLQVQGRSTADDKAYLAAEGAAEFPEDEGIVEEVVREHAQDAAVQLGSGIADAAGVIDSLVDERLLFRRQLGDALVYGRLQSVNHSGDHQDYGGLIVFDVALEIAYVFRYGAGAAAHESTDDLSGHGIGVPIRQQRHQAVGLRHVEALECRPGIVPDVFVGQHHPFGHAGGAAGINKTGDIVETGFHRLTVRRLRPALDILPVVHGTVAGILPHFCLGGGIHQDKGRLAVANDKRHLGVAQAFTDRDGNQAQLPAGVKKSEMPGGLGRNGDHAVAGLDLLGLEILAPGVDQTPDLGIAVALDLIAVGRINQSRVAGEFLHRLIKQSA